MSDNRKCLPPGFLLCNGRYKILSEIGRGGYGLVYKAENTETGQFVAVKEFYNNEWHIRNQETQELMESQERRPDIELKKEKIREEVNKIKTFDNYYIIEAYEGVFEENNTCYYAMEYVEGCSLRAYCKENGGMLREEEALDIIIQIAEALKAMHSKGCNHCDVKPQNILIDKMKKRAVLIDFGAAQDYRSEDSWCQRETTSDYAPKYSSLYNYFMPCRDIYSLGATLYNIMTGRLPSENVWDNSGFVSEGTFNAIKRALEVNPGFLLRSVDEFIYLLPKNRKGLKDEISNRVTPHNVKYLKENQIFVFGSNIYGYHDGGAAGQALRKWGAKWGVAVGPQGKAYAIPTVSGRANNVKLIEPYAEQFTQYAKEHPEKEFLLIEVGCGVAGFTPQQVAPFFKACIDLPNVYLPESFWRVLRNKGFMEPRVQVSQHD